MFKRPQLLDTDLDESWEEVRNLLPAASCTPRSVELLWLRPTIAVGPGLLQAPKQRRWCKHFCTGITKQTMWYMLAVLLWAGQWGKPDHRTSLYCCSEKSICTSIREITMLRDTRQRGHQLPSAHRQEAQMDQMRAPRSCRTWPRLKYSHTHGQTASVELEIYSLKRLHWSRVLRKCVHPTPKMTGCRPIIGFHHRLLQEYKYKLRVGHPHLIPWQKAWQSSWQPFARAKNGHEGWGV